MCRFVKYFQTTIATSTSTNQTIELLSFRKKKLLSHSFNLTSKVTHTHINTSNTTTIKESAIQSYKHAITSTFNHTSTLHSLYNCFSFQLLPTRTLTIWNSCKIHCKWRICCVAIRSSCWKLLKIKCNKWKK